MTFGFAILFNTILAASVCGTFAWYAYATRTGFEKQYHGVTIGDTGELQVGIISKVELSDHEQFNLAEDKETLADENKIIYWCDNVIESETLNYIIGANGSATTELHPVTTGSNDILDSRGFHLYKNPVFLRDYAFDENFYADENSYVHIPFAFRFESPDKPDEYISGKDIFFTECEADAGSEIPNKNGFKALRVYLTNGLNGYLINPSEDKDGCNAVGGILDLNKDGFYDYFSNKEFLYGESISYTYNENLTLIDGTIPVEERTTFFANHKAGIYAINEMNYEPKVINYRCMLNFENKSTIVATTNASDHFLARLDFYVFAEGWDLSVIDQEINSGFNINARFQVKIDE